jgi:hypothetical protein
MPSKSDKASRPPSPSAALVEAVRALVREELDRPAPPITPVQSPTWRDGFWLLVFVVNVVFFVDLIPEKWSKHPALEMLGRILPWLGGGTFVLGATWFRERLLAFSRSRRFMVTMAAACVPLLLLQVRFVSLRPKIDPPDSPFYVDGALQTPQQGTFQGQARIWLRLTGHAFKIQPHDSGGKTAERAIEWGWTRLLGAWLGNHQPQWALVYPLTITTDGEGCKVHIAKSNPKEQLDTDFYDERLKKADDSLEFEPKDNSETIKLPMGTYEFSVEKKGCETLKPPGPVNVPSKEPLDLGTMTCPTK